MRTLYRIGFSFIIMALGLWWTYIAPLSAQARTHEMVSAWDEEEDFQACATLVGEGELCGWPQVDPDAYAQDDFVQDELINPDRQDQTEAILTEGETQEPACPIVVGAGALCSGPETPEFQVDGAAGECKIPIGEGVVGCGPEIPAAGHEITFTRLFAPTVSNRP